MLGIETVVAAPVGGDRAGRGGEGDDRARGRVHLGEALGVGTETAREGVVAASVEHHDIHPVLGRVHFLQHEIGAHRLILDLVLAFNIAPDRNKIIATLHLHAVAGVVEQSDAAPFEFVAEDADGLAHGGLGEVVALGDLEARLTQRAGDGARVVAGIFEWRDFVVAVTDDERDTPFGTAGGRRGFGDAEITLVGSENSNGQQPRQHPRGPAEPVGMFVLQGSHTLPPRPRYPSIYPCKRTLRQRWLNRRQSLKDAADFGHFKGLDLLDRRNDENRILAPLRPQRLANSPVISTARFR